MERKSTFLRAIFGGDCFGFILGPISTTRREFLVNFPRICLKLANRALVCHFVSWFSPSVQLLLIESPCGCSRAPGPHSEHNHHESSPSFRKIECIHVTCHISVLPGRHMQTWGQRLTSYNQAPVILEDLRRFLPFQGSARKPFSNNAAMPCLAFQFLGIRSCSRYPKRC